MKLSSYRFYSIVRQFFPNIGKTFKNRGNSLLLSMKVSDKHKTFYLWKLLLNEVNFPETCPTSIIRAQLVRYNTPFLRGYAYTSKLLSSLFEYVHSYMQYVDTTRITIVDGSRQLYLSIIPKAFINNQTIVQIL